MLKLNWICVVQQEIQIMHELFFWDLIDGQIMFRKESKTLCKTTIYLGKSKEMIKPWIINIKMGGKKWIFLGGVKTIYRVYPALLNTQLLDNTDICHNGKSA